MLRLDNHNLHSLEVFDPGLSDHFAVRFKMAFSKPKPTKTTVEYRSFKDVNKLQLRESFSQLNFDSASSTVSDLVDQYNSSLSSIIDEHVPLQTKTFTIRPNTKWYNDNIRQAKVIKRRLERKWKKSGLNADWTCFRDQCKLVSNLLNAAKCEFYSQKLLKLKRTRENFLKRPNLYSILEITILYQQIMIVIAYLILLVISFWIKL